MGWIRIRMDPELGKFRAGSGISHIGSTTLEKTQSLEMVKLLSFYFNTSTKLRFVVIAWAVTCG